MDHNDEEKLKNAQFDHERFLQYLEDVRNSIPDIQPEPFLNTMTECVKMFNVIGSSIAFAFKDITSKVGIIRRNYTNTPEVKGGLITFVEYEEKLKIQRLNGENPKEAPDPKYKHYESTSRTLLRLMWFLDFMSCLVNYIEGNRALKTSECCKKAYDEALGPHHPFAVRMAAKTAMSFTPSREKFLKELFPAEMTEEQKYLAFKKCGENLKPIKEHLWKYYGDHKLKELP